MLIFVLITSCTNQDIKDNYDFRESSTTAEEHTTEVYVANTSLYKETAALLGKVMTDSKVRTAVNNKLKEVDSYGELASLAYLLGSDKGLKKEENA